MSRVVVPTGALSALCLLLAGACTPEPDGEGPTTDPTDGTVPTETSSTPTSSTTLDTKDREEDISLTASVQLASEIDDSAPTTVGIVTFEVSVPIDAARIEFGLAGAFDRAAPVDLTGDTPRAMLIGMKPETTYEWRVVYASADVVRQGPTETVTTGALPDDVPAPTVERSEGSEPGFLVVSEWRRGRNEDPYVYILDPDGDVVWWYQSRLTGPCAARISEGGQSLWILTPNNSGAEIERVRMDTLDNRVWSGLGATHDLVTMPGDDCAIFIAYNEQDDLYQLCAGDESPTVVSNVGSQGGTARHLNAIRYDAEEDLLITSDVSTALYGVEPDTGDVIWQLPSSRWGGRQHAMHLLEGSILVFANNGGPSNTSAIVELDRTEFREIWSVDLGVSVPNLGDVQRLPGGNTLVHLSGVGGIVEIAPDGSVVSEVDTFAGYGFWMQDLYQIEPRP